MAKKVKDMKERELSKAKGVRTHPMWDCIPISHYIVPVLHIHIGLGNDVLNHLLDIIDRDIEKISPEEQSAWNDLVSIENAIKQLHHKRDEYDKTEGVLVRNAKVKIKQLKDKLAKVESLGVHTSVPPSDAPSDKTPNSSSLPTPSVAQSTPATTRPLVSPAGPAPALANSAVPQTTPSSTNGTTADVSTPSETGMIPTPSRPTVSSARSTTPLADSAAPQITPSPTNAPTANASTTSETDTTSATAVATNAKISQEIQEQISKLQADVDKGEGERKKKYAEKIKKMDNMKKRLSDQLADFRKKRKCREGGVESAINAILHRYNIKREAYHGGDLNGVCVRRLMADCEEILEEIAKLLKAESKGHVLNEDIDKICKDHALLLRRIDMAISGFRKQNPTEASIEKTERAIKASMALLRKLGLSVTPKAYVLEDHAIRQMRAFDGLWNKTEDFVERSHQDGARNDHRTQGLKHYQQRQEAQHKGAHRKSNQEVQRIKQEMASKKQSRGGSDSITAERKQKREALREAALPQDSKGGSSLKGELK